MIVTFFSVPQLEIVERKLHEIFEEEFDSLTAPQKCVCKNLGWKPPQGGLTKKDLQEMLDANDMSGWRVDNRCREPENMKIWSWAEPDENDNPKWVIAGNCDNLTLSIYDDLGLTGVIAFLAERSDIRSALSTHFRCDPTAAAVWRNIKR